VINSVNLSLLPSFYVCADGNTEEITEATYASFIQNGSAAFFNEYNTTASSKYI